MTRVEQRLNSNHGRLVHAARAVPQRLRLERLPGWDWTPRDILAHVLAWQEEALRHLRDPEVSWPGRGETDGWNAAAHQRLRHLGWDEIIEQLEANHRTLRLCLGDDPPRWLGHCTYWHYTEHTRSLLAFVRSAAQSSTTTVVPMAAQS